MVDRDEMILFVRKRLGFVPTPETKFWWGTGIAGLDAYAFMAEFGDHYGVNFNDAAIDIDYGDGDASFGDTLGRLWRRMTFQSVPRTGYFTIDHLVEVANRKKWFDPEQKG